MPVDLKGQVMIVTGASKGLGRGLCKYFSNKGLNVIGIARDEEKGNSLKEEIEKSGGSFEFHKLDIRDFEGIKEFIKKVEEKWKRIDILVNNAAYVDWIDFCDLKKEDIDIQIDVNLKGPIYITRFVAPMMMKAKAGQIVNITSIRAWFTHGDNGLYSASKHGFKAFSYSMAKMLRDYNIKVHTLRPGGMDTDIWQRGEYPYKREQLMSPEEVSEIIENILKSGSTTVYSDITFMPFVELHLMP